MIKTFETTLRRSLYDDLWEAYKISYPNKQKNVVQQLFWADWSELKKKANGNDSILDNLVQSKKKLMLQKVSIQKSNNMLRFLKPFNEKNTTNSLMPTKSSQSSNLQISSSSDSFKKPVEPLSNVICASATENRSENSACSGNDSEENTVTSYFAPTPAQERSKKRIEELQSQICSLIKVKNMGLISLESETKLSRLKKELTTEEINLKKKINDAKRKRTSRKKFNDTIKKVCIKHPDLKADLKFRENRIGRLRIEDAHPEFLEAIIDIAICGSAADSRRRTELVRTCKTLTELTEELNKMGIEVSRSTVYTRLIPHRSNTHEGKRHVNTVPVKLCRPEADQHAKHPDGYFCHATITALETVASVLGPEEVCFLSRDDKARVPIGITAAKSQAPMLMHMQYKVSLPDHDWVKAERHKLIPSVYAGIDIKANGDGCPNAVSYSGPTYVAIRSGKHSTSTAETHATDFDRVLSLKGFEYFVKNKDGIIKPVVIITCDGGPDENPRYPRVIYTSIAHFLKYNLDALFVATNAPGRSAYNRVERRMAPLSYELTAVVLPHDHFGSHLDENNRTINKELELKNFARAGEVLAEIWNNLTIDGYSVHAEYIQPKEETPAPACDALWYAKHVKESQYFLQIVRCDDRECCSPWRSSLKYVLKSGFLPPPVPITQSPAGLQLLPYTENIKKFCPLLLRLALNLEPQFNNSTEIPYDMYCPTVQTKLVDRICSECKLYHASIKSQKLHKKLHKKLKTSNKIKPKNIILARNDEFLCVINDCKTGAEDVEWISQDDVIYENVLLHDTKDVNDICVIESLSDWLVSPWTKEE